MKSNLRNSTLVFPIKKSEGNITEICLAMKKRGFGVNRWNGAGGKVNETQGETIEEAALREAREEIGIEVRQLNKIAELSFYFPHNSDWNQTVHVYFSEAWAGDPCESEEMAPKWFLPSELPFFHMWPDDIFWLPKVLEGNLLKAVFHFGEGDVILEKEVRMVERFF